jgi:hypothetical protein
VQRALETLRYVEQDSIQIDIPNREVRFNLKDKQAFKEDEVKAALKDEGFKEVTVKSAPQ